MHKSQLAGFIIDCKTDDLDDAASFWGQALGFETAPEEGDARYMLLKTRPEDIHLEVQQVDHDSRVHLDIETDDIEAEITRLEQLGARRIGPVKGWVVMEAPTGQRFCIVKVQRSGFEKTANRWD